jgi:glutamine---fructose-6-phosphate transaminase (isomerizing)
LLSVSHSLEQAITKFASDGDKADAIDLVRVHSAASAGHTVGIAHTRWATHGGKTDANAHPHTDSSGKIALVHNGTINNANELRKELLKLGHTFQGTTDSEVLAKLIGHYYEKATTASKRPSASLVKLATENALSRCDGSWGLCVMCSDIPGELIVACHGSPMVIGVADDRTFVASETSAFSRFTKNFISMNDGEIGVLHPDARTFDLTRTQRAPDDQQFKVALPESVPHWTLKEICEQPEAIARALSFGGRLASDKISLGGLEKNFDRLCKIKYVTLTACGSSLNAARYGERLMKQLGSFDRVTTIEAAEFDDDDDFPCPENVQATGLIVVSQSGETQTVQEIVKQALDKDITCISVVNEVGSLIARTTKMGVYCNAGREYGVTSTKGFSTQVVVLALIALWFRQKRDYLEGRRNSVDTIRLKEALMRLPISFGMALKLREQCQQVAKRLNTKEHCFVLGKGFGESIALEGAMKIKEICYLHAEGYSGGALKHGPFALIENDETGKFGATPIIMLILDDNHAHHMRIAAEETKARGADLIIITDKPELAEGLDDNPLVIPNNGPLTALGAILPLQLIAYELAVLR